MADVQDVIVNTFQRESRIVIAALLTTVRDIELAEDALQDAMVEALRTWPERGIPNNPGAWIMTTARRKSIDRLRRVDTARKHLPTLKYMRQLEQAVEIEMDELPDERLKLMFTCCHPALAQEAQVALTLQVVAGLSTVAIAKAFLVTTTTMSQRLVRAKRKIRDAAIPYEIPPLDRLNDRLDSVLAVLYLIFNAGYLAPTGSTLVQVDISQEAIRLTRTLHDLLTSETKLGPHAETVGLLSLMLLHHARFAARTGTDGQIVLLERQDRRLWDQQAILEGTALLDRAIELGQRGPYQIQAAIAALHAQAKEADDTDWAQIALLYNALMEFTPSSVVELNRAVAVAMAHGPLLGMAILDNLSLDGRLNDYYLYHAARADLLSRLGNSPEATEAYQRAIGLCENKAEITYLEQRLKSLLQ